MILDITGYNTSGSGALHDLFHEFDNTIYPRDTDWEFELLWMVDGIYDLESKLYEKNILGFDSDIAIQRFEKLVYALNNKPVLNYGKVFKDDFFLECSKNYIKKIIGIEYMARDFSDLVYQTKNDEYKQQINKYIRIFLGNRIARKIWGRGLSYRLQIDDRHKAKLSSHPNNFLQITQDYMQELFDYCKKGTNKILITDHLFPASNQDLYYKYIKEDFKSIIVKRDPRDCYLIAKVRYGSRDVPLPVGSVEDFIWFYKHFIEDVALPDTDDRITINFEDIIYKYDETLSKLCSFVDLGKHAFPKTMLNPEVSINNTQLFKLYKGFEEDIKKIENALPNSLYNFGDYTFNRTVESVF